MCSNSPQSGKISHSTPPTFSEVFVNYIFFFFSGVFHLFAQHIFRLLKLILCLLFRFRVESFPFLFEICVARCVVSGSDLIIFDEQTQNSLNLHQTFVVVVFFVQFSTVFLLFEYLKGCASWQNNAAVLSKNYLSTKPEKLFIVSSTCAYIINFIAKSIQSPITPRKTACQMTTSLGLFAIKKQKRRRFTMEFRRAKRSCRKTLSTLKNPCMFCR